MGHGAPVEQKMEQNSRPFLSMFVLGPIGVLVLDQSALSIYIYIYTYIETIPF
jgi:hypothetical protein